MSRWLVTHGEQQFSASDLEELKTMAADRRLKPADLVQPPGASDWIYAIELPDLKGSFPDGASDLDDDSDLTRSSRLPRVLLAVVLIFVTLFGIGAMWTFKKIIDGADWDGMEAGKAQLNSDVDLRQSPRSGGALVSGGDLEKGDIVEVKLKHMNETEGNWLWVESGSKKGWIPAASAPPNFLFDQEDRDTNEPLFYPENYVTAELKVSAERMSDLNYGRKADGHIRLKQLFLDNLSPYEMTNVEISIAAYSESGAELDRITIPITDPLPANTKQLPVGGIFPDFQPPSEFRRPAERERAKTMDSKLGKIDANDQQTLTEQCMPIKEVYDMPELMEQIDYQSHMEVRMLGAGQEAYGQRAEGWKHCFDVELDVGDVENYQLQVGIHQVRANPDWAKSEIRDE